MKRIAFAAALFCLAPLSANAADGSGIWVISASGQPEITCTLKQNETLLLGDCKSVSAAGGAYGSVSGDNVHWDWHWVANEDKVPGISAFNGALGDETLSGKMTIAGMQTDFTARRSGDLPADYVVPRQVASIPPKSIWNNDTPGFATHQQSGLVCPDALAGFRRSDLHMYDRYGFDVSCNYTDNSTGVLLTVYLTRVDPAQFQAMFEGQKASLTKMYAGAAQREPSLEFTSGFTWLKAGYVVRDGALWSDLYVALVNDWQLKLRITYPPATAPDVGRLVSALSAQVEKSAVPHLKACAAAPTHPAATRITDAKRLYLIALSGSLPYMAESVREITVKPAASLTWCAEGGVSAGPNNLVYARALENPTAMGSPVLRIQPVAGGPLITVLHQPPLKGETGGPAYYVTFDYQGQVEVNGAFDNIPTVRQVGEMVLSGKRPVISSYDRAGKKLNIGAPPP